MGIRCWRRCQSVQPYGSLQDVRRPDLQDRGSGRARLPRPRRFWRRHDHEGGDSRLSGQRRFGARVRDQRYRHHGRSDRHCRGPKLAYPGHQCRPRQHPDQFRGRRFHRGLHHHGVHPTGYLYTRTAGNSRLFRNTVVSLNATSGIAIGAGTTSNTEIDNSHSIANLFGVSADKGNNGK